MERDLAKRHQDEQRSAVAVPAGVVVAVPAAGVELAVAGIVVADEEEHLIVRT